MSFGGKLLYRVVHLVLLGFCKTFWRLEVLGAENIPKSGPFILSGVHRSNVDTPLVAVITPRRLRFMGKDTMWKYRWSAWFFTTLGGVPVRRGAADREALRQCRDVLDAGEPLVLFPEGTRKSGPVIDPLERGAAYLSGRTGAPIVPVGIGGSEVAMPKGSKWIKPVKIVMVVGEPIQPERDAAGKASQRATRELNERLRDELQRLFDDAQERAGRPNTAPWN